jgi:hypothetical protein
VIEFWGVEVGLDGTGESRLGGRPFLTELWPQHDGHGLTHLASIALAELPDFAGRELLPAKGVLVFLADFGSGWDRVRTGGPQARIISIAPGTVTTRVIAPVQPRGRHEVPVELEERELSFAPGERTEPGDVRLLAMVFASGDRITFSGTREDIQAGRWERLTAERDRV